ncbi:MAG: response regulator transcription factor [Dehalococcoidales bacterium]|nr:response regulator transcription factor [Dehalococcoidales bacterium]
MKTKVDGESVSNKNKIRIILADDHPLMRQALITSLGKEPDFEIIAEASDGEQVVKFTKDMNPDIIIMDIGMPKLNGIEATRQIYNKYPNIAVLVLTIHIDNDTVLSIFQAGARGYLVKTATGKEVIQAIRTIMSGETVWSLPISNKIIQATAHPMNASSRGLSRKISPRELDILKLLSKGMSNKAIGIQLGIQETSVKAYLTSLFTKLGVGTRTEAVSVGLQIGILTFGDLTQKRE